MPRPVEDLKDGEPLPVKPGTYEYRALSFLVSNRHYGFTPIEIAARTTISEESASKTLARLFEKGIVERSQGVYFVDPERADALQGRLDSLDAATRLHSIAPDDAYAEPGWEDELPRIADDQNPDQSV